MPENLLSVSGMLEWLAFLVLVPLNLREERKEKIVHPGEVTSG